MSVGFSQSFRLNLDLISGTIKQYIQEPNRKPDAVSDTLGIGRRKLDGIHGWLKHMHLRDSRKSRLSELCKLICAADPNFNSYGTHILLHYLLTSNRDAEVWYGLFNQLLSQNESFNRDDAMTFFENRGITSSHLKSDVGMLLKMYSAEDVRALADIKLLNKREGSYLLQPIQDIPPRIFAFCLYDYRERHTQESTTSFARLLAEPERPGKIFGLGESDLRSMLITVEWEGLITIVHSADINGIAYSYEGRAIDLLREHFNLDLGYVRWTS